MQLNLEGAGVAIDRILPWSEPRVVQTRYGTRLLRVSDPDNDFWYLWKMSRDALREQGIMVRLDEQKNRYAVLWFVEPENERKQLRLGLGAAALGAQSPVEGLLEYQVKPCMALARMWSRKEGWRGTLDASDTGVGKTYMALAAARASGRIPTIICRKGGKGAWRKAAKHLGVSIHALANWESMRTGRHDFISRVKVKRSMSYSWSLPKNSILICDEAHWAKGQTTLNSKAIMAAMKQGICTHLVSATPATSPMEMRVLGYATGLHNDDDYYPWMMRNGVEKVDGRWQFDKKTKREYLRQIARQIFPEHGIRVRIRDLGDAFPPTQITTELINLETTAEINQLYDLLAVYLKRLKERTDLYSDNPMSEILAIRQKIELLKVPALIAMAEEAVEAGLSVPIFVNFHGTMEALSDGLKTDCVVCGIGRAGLTERQREENIRKFQSDKSHTIIVQSASGGESIDLHDVLGRRPRKSLIMPMNSVINLKQVLGRVHRATAKSRSLQRLVCVEGTVEERLAENLDNNLKNIAALLHDDDIVLEDKDINVERFL